MIIPDVFEESGPSGGGGEDPYKGTINPPFVRCGQTVVFEIAEPRGRYGAPNYVFFIDSDASRLE